MLFRSLGRTYLADNKPAMAVEAFYANYQNNPRGDRAPDSLYWLGQALMKLDKPQEACKVYGELTDVYGAKMSATLKDQAAKARVAAKRTEERSVGKACVRTGRSRGAPS